MGARHGNTLGESALCQTVTVFYITTVKRLSRPQGCGRKNRLSGSRMRVGRMRDGGIRLSGLCSVIHNVRVIPTIIASQTMSLVILSRSPDSERSEEEGAAKNLS